jgi:DNA/RNA endonuclease YhcR with UshA esterase domain
MKKNNIAFEDDFKQPICANKTGEGVKISGVKVTTEITPTGNKGVVRLEVSTMVHCALSLGEDNETYFLDADEAKHLIEVLKQAVEEAEKP